MAYINYDDTKTIVEALQGIQALVITLSVSAAQNTESKLLQAAAEAGVPYVIPNWNAQDPSSVSLLDAVFVRAKCYDARELVQKLGVSSWIQMACGFWYEFSLSFGPDAFGFDFENRKVNWLDGGDTKITSTTWQQCGRAMAALLSLPRLPLHEGDDTPTLAQFCNDVFYIESFEISQKDMFDSVKRVTGTSDEDWTFSNGTARDRYEEAIKAVQSGDMSGYTKLLYSRVLYPDDPGNFSSKVQNSILKLPMEDLDERTRVAVEMAAKKSTSQYVNETSNEGRRKMMEGQK